MYLIQQITDDPNQTQTVVLPNTGIGLTLTMYYVQQQYGWFMDISYGSTFTVTGMRITVNPNMLKPWQNILGFGLGCMTSLSREPTQITDFSTSAFQLNVLTSDELSQLNAFLSTGNWPST